MEHLKWEIYRTSFIKLPEDVLNEYQSDLHNMKMKEELFQNMNFCPNYLKVLCELEEFESTNLDFFNYEKELNFGEGD